MQKLTFTLTLMTAWACLDAQQIAQWNQFRTLGYVVNPAIVNTFDVGYNDHLDVHLAYTTLWISNEEAPRTALAGMQYTDADLNMSFSGYLQHDKFGPATNTQLKLNYAYQLRLERWRDHVLSIGLSFSATQYRFNALDIDVIDENDDLLNFSDQTKLLPNAGLGIYYYRGFGPAGAEELYVFGGLSADQLIPNDITFDGTSGKLKKEAHYQGFGGFRKYYLGQDYIEPYVWANKVKNAPMSFGTAVRMTFLEQKLWGGLGLSTGFRPHLSFGLKLFDALSIDYNSAFHMSKIFSTTPGMQHEIVLSYRYVL